MEQGFEIALDPISRHRRPRRLTPARLEKSHQQGDKTAIGKTKSFLVLSSCPLPWLTHREIPLLYKYKTVGGLAETRIHTPRLYHFGYPVPVNWTGGGSSA